ncbi:Oxygen-dependent choline dehydrogenase [Pseudocercospora fuligena]|uniref:Oxygen-dependent choline dehydrogenase n=1 Tax=Pseudocercospora fuligena TaxID=685502 RepID=A0A8H6RCG2_9PEZI|nr:Oxygen-dependent choline dehydrogenase [Pseudocercospora fuligena]
MLLRQVFHFALLATGWASDAHLHHKHHNERRQHEEHIRDDSISEEPKHENVKRQSWGQGQYPSWYGCQSCSYPAGWYDYIVVGSGPGGGPLACRLARAGFNVLLIDAGDDSSAYAFATTTPVFQLQASEEPEQAWDYYVWHYADQGQQARDSKTSYACPDRIYTGLYPYAGCVMLGVLYPRASALGGCSQHHSMIMVYPWEADWEHLQQITGNSTWSADAMRSYFVKLERNQYIPSSVVGHGYQGWLQTSLTALTLVLEDFKVASLIVAAATAMGKVCGQQPKTCRVGKMLTFGAPEHRRGVFLGLLDTVTGLAHILITDLNAPGRSRDEEENIFQVPISVDPQTSKRAGVRDFIIATAQQYPNLHIQLNTFVTRVLIDNSGYGGRPRAYGVQYEVGRAIYQADPRWTGARGQPGYAFAIRETIVSGGSFETPKLLKLSGIGPAAELQHFGIPVIVDNPYVGTNMQDRYEYSVVSEAPTPFELTKDCTFGYAEPDPCKDRYLAGNNAASRGVYATNGLAFAVTMKSSVAETNIPDVYITGTTAYFQGYYKGFARDTFADAKHWMYLILKAQSRNNAGTVTLRSTNALERPQITFNSLAIGGDQDVQAVMDAVAFARRAYHAALPLTLETVTEVDPGEAGYPDYSPQLAQNIKDRTWGHHASCTCAIGLVLDGDFRVLGVDGLRVVDASAFNKIPGFFLCLPTYILSEKAADAILGQSPDPFFSVPDAGGLLGTLGNGLVAGIVTGLGGSGEQFGTDANANGLLGDAGSILGLNLIQNTNPLPPNKIKRTDEL